MKRVIACLCFALLLFATACQQIPVATPSQSPFSDTDDIQPIQSVTYPKILAYDDYEGRSALRDENPLEETFVKKLLSFSYWTAAQTLGQTDGNANYSPLSLYFALALVTTGAAGETQSQLLQALGAADADALSKQCGNLYRRLYTNHSVTKLQVANSLWMAKTLHSEPVTFHDRFLQNALDQFYTSMFLVDFGADGIGKAIGKWISDNTNGTLSPSVPVSPDQILSIINTVYFNDQWANQFDAGATSKDVFHLRGGTNVTCDFLNQTFPSRSVFKGDGFIRTSLGLKGGGNMIFILPEEGSSAKQLVSSPDSLQALFEGGEEKNVELVFKVPKFKLTSSFDLVGTLQKLGVQSAFQAGADFSALSDQPSYISNVNQETYISINEYGVEASAYTAISLSGAALPGERMELSLDRPFLYGITTADGALLFLGICENPTQP